MLDWSVTKSIRRSHDWAGTTRYAYRACVSGKILLLQIVLLLTFHKLSELPETVRFFRFACFTKVTGHIPRLLSWTPRPILFRSPLKEGCLREWLHWGDCLIFSGLILDGLFASYFAHTSISVWSYLKIQRIHRFTRYLPKNAVSFLLLVRKHIQKQVANHSGNRFYSFLEQLLGLYYWWLRFASKQLWEEYFGATVSEHGWYMETTSWDQRSRKCSSSEQECATILSFFVPDLFFARRAGINGHLAQSDRAGPSDAGSKHLYRFFFTKVCGHFEGTKGQREPSNHQLFTICPKAPS